MAIRLFGKKIGKGKVVADIFSKPEAPKVTLKDASGTVVATIDPANKKNPFTVINPQIFYKPLLGIDPVQQHEIAEMDYGKGKYENRKVFVNAQLTRIKNLADRYVIEIDRVANKAQVPNWQSYAGSIVGTVGTTAQLAQPFGLLIKGAAYVLSRTGAIKQGEAQSEAAQAIPYLTGQMEYLQAEFNAYKIELEDIESEAAGNKALDNLVPMFIILLSFIIYNKKHKTANH
ncbi:hypothetical protein [Larkinella rosea]|uniref:Uncharacterized protein n=1 Tax=Larkinella rosea TaxID=2025312 RepID=A0A3P1BSQ4_9BACT|nr:hypothetical protein [Larkinella rosea]RRB03896.1 hypothetical protein EHT25_10195 [Larkinella rosea]